MDERSGLLVFGVLLPQIIIFIVLMVVVFRTLFRLRRHALQNLPPSKGLGSHIVNANRADFAAWSHFFRSPDFRRERWFIGVLVGLLYAVMLLTKWIMETFIVPPAAT